MIDKVYNELVVGLPILLYINVEGELFHFWNSRGNPPLLLRFYGQLLWKLSDSDTIHPLCK